MLTNRIEKVEIKHGKNLEASRGINKTKYVYENLKDYNPTKKIIVLIVFDDMIVGMKANKKLSPLVTKKFMRDRKLNILHVFMTQSYLKVPKDIRLNTIHFIMKENSNK